MAISARIRELDSKHRQLDAAIQAEMRRPGADSTQIRQMKREKLKLKEEIESLRSSEPH